MVEVYRHTRAAPVVWQRELERYWPRSNRLTWLKLVWEPGFRVRSKDDFVEFPVQRWVIYEMVPTTKFVPPEVLSDLNGVSPRRRGHEVRDPDTGFRGWMSDSLVSKTQWELYRETGQYGRRFWIIQGDHGGHPETFSEAEKMFLQMRGRPDLEIPEPGDLPYADFDQRVMRRLLTLDKLAKWDQSILWDQRSERKSKAGVWLRRDRQAEEMTFNTQLLDYLDDTIEGLTRDLSHKAMRDVVDAANPELPAFRGDLDRQREEIIADTSF